jgi:hypothetical protein
MTPGERCTCCGCAVPEDAARAGYVHVVEGAVTGVAFFRMCERCIQQSKTNPDRAVVAMRRAYRAEMN